MKRQNLFPLFPAALGLAAVIGCSAGGSEGSGKLSGGSSSGNYTADAGVGLGSDRIPDAAAALPPENEQNVSFLAPRAGARYVYVANPTRNTVSIIDSQTLAVTEVAPGDSPTYVATVPGQDVALVINVGSHTLRILRGTAMNAAPIPIVAQANAVAISPDGLHAVIWFDTAQGLAGATSTSASSAQEVSVVSLSDAMEKAFAMSVGYNPSAVVFSEDNAAAFVVADNGISELRFADITAPAIAPFTPYTSTTTRLAGIDGGVSTPDAQSPPLPPSGTRVDGGVSALDGGVATEAGQATPDNGEPADAASTPPPTRTTSSNAKVVDVSVTPNGRYAIARREGTDELLLIDLLTDAITSFEMSSPVTDLDLMPSGSEAFAVLREESKLVRIEVPAGFTDPTRRAPWSFESGTVGSVSMSKQGRYAVLYSTATTSKKLVILDLARGTECWVEMQKAVRAVATAPDEKTALVLHTLPDATGTDGKPSALDKAYGYTMVRLEDGFPKWQDTAADPNPFAITPNSTDVFVLLRDDKAGVRVAQRMSLTSFTTQDFPLGSPPDSIAALSQETHKVFVGQVHSEGRISFIDWESGSVESVTGFALNGRIRQ